MTKKIIEMRGGVCVHEFEYHGAAAPALAAVHMDVTARSDGPFLGKLYDAESGTFSDPPPPPPEETEETEETEE